MNVVMTTWGSLGDLHPYLALGIELRRRGHHVRLVTGEYYRTKIEHEGLEFAASRPNLEHLLSRPEVWRAAYHPRTGTEYILRRLFLPYIDQMYEDLLACSQQADILIGHPLAFAVPLVAEKLGKRWMSVALAPISLLSAHDPPVFPAAPFLTGLRRFGPDAFRVVYAMIRVVTRGWMRPIFDLRRRNGLRTDVPHPMLEGWFSPHGTLALFSAAFSPPQPDWPQRTTVCGFPFFDKANPDVRLDPALDEFVHSGPPPVVFTLGSSAVYDAGAFYEESARAAVSLGQRAVLLVGSDPNFQPRIDPHPLLYVAAYAPYSKLFPQARAVVHQCGIGTMAQTLRAGLPLLAVPFSHDQPDNAMRAERLGVARIVVRHRYRAPAAARALQALLQDGGYGASALRVAATLAQEDGARAAADAIERAAAA